MTYFRLAMLTVVLTGSVLLGACSKSEEPAAMEPTGPSNELLSHVPADTPYLMANLQPFPEEVIDTHLARVKPGLDEMQAQLTVIRNRMEASDNPEASGDPTARLALAALRELDGKLSRSGFESLGVDITAHHAVYGMGAFPVFRLQLANPDVLRETINRVLNDAQIEAPELEFQGKSYWRLSDDDGTHAPVGIYLSVLDDQLAAGIFPTMSESEFLPLFLGLEMPAESDARARLTALNRTHGYTPFASGILDLHKLADQFLQADSSLMQLMVESGEVDPSSITQACVEEIHGMIDNAPTWTAGTTEFSGSAISLQYRVETPESLAQQLMGLVSNIPGAQQASSRIMEFAFGMRFGPVRDFLREKTMAITEQPYQCEHLQDLNKSASDSLAKLNEPMPPFLNNFRGLRISLSEIMMGQDSIPQDAKGHLAVHVKQPEMFVGMAQMFLPDLSELAITAGDPPVRLPESVIPVPNVVAYAAMSSDAIGLSLGEGEEAELPEFLNRDAEETGSFLSVNYDMRAYQEYVQNMSDVLNVQYDSDHDEDEHFDAAREIAKAFNEAAMDIEARNHTTLRFTSEGFVADTSISYP